MIPTNSAGVAGRIDDAGRIITSSDIPYAIEQGIFYRASHYTTSIAAAGKIKYVIDPSGCLCPYRLQVNVTAEQDIRIMFYEGAAPTANGTAVTTHNFNRQHAADGSGNWKIYHTPTVAADASGNICAPDIRMFIASGAGPFGANMPSTGGNQNYTLLNPARVYLVEIINTDSAATQTQVYFRMMEEPTGG